METYLNITIKVQKAQAEAAIKSVQTQWRQMSGALSGRINAGGLSALTGQINSLVGRLRSAGYAMSTAFTAPLVAMGRRVMQFTLDNQTAFAELQKVYGNAGAGPNAYAKELAALQKNFEALSNEYGVNRAEVIQVGAAWAQAGVQGAALASSVNTTMRAMVIGGLSATKTTDALIAIQAQYGASSAGLVKILNTLNVVENQTGVSMGGLIDGFQRAAGSAAALGVDYRHLAAMIAALSPAAGSAAQAGNSLKTILSRLAAPTKDASDILGKLGIHIQDIGWKSATGTQRIERIALAMHGLDRAQQAVVASTLASRFQVNRFVVLMNDVYNGTAKSATGLSYYKIALDATKDSNKNAKIAQQELNTVLQSNPHLLQQIGVMMKNTFSDILVPLLPTIIAVTGKISEWATAFGNLNPVWQKFIGFGLLALAMLGPVLLYISALGSAFQVLFMIMKVAAAPFGLVFKLLGGIAGAVTGAIASLFGLGGASEESALVAGRAAEQTSLAADKAARASERAVATNERAITRAAKAAAIASKEAEKAAAIWNEYVTSMADRFEASMGTSVAAAEAAAGELTAIFTGESVDLQTLWTETFTAMSAIPAAEGAKMLTGWELTLAAIAQGTAAAGIDLNAIWAETFTGVAGLPAAAGGEMIAGWDAALAAIAAGTTGAAVDLNAIWAGAGANIVAITEATQSQINAVWAAGMTQTTSTTSLALTATDAEIAGAMAEAVVTMEAAIQAGTVVWDEGMAQWVTVVAAGMATVDAEVAAGMAAADVAVAGGVEAAGGIMAGAIAILTSPWTILVGVILSVVWAFRNQIGQVWDDIVTTASRLFHMLPDSVQNAMQEVVNVVANAAKQVYEFFSYINPFAHHSPSLVENVTNGMDIIKAKISSITDVEGPIKHAYDMLQNFSRAGSGVLATDRRRQVNADVSNIRKAGGSSALIADYRGLANEVDVLTAQQNALSGAIKNQQSVVDADKASLDAANNTLTNQNNILTTLKDTQSKWSNAMQHANSAISTLANTTIAGQTKLGNTIFANEQAQKSLQLQMMKMEDITGPIADVQSKMSALNGEISTLSAKRNDLRMAGAGSDILKQYDDQINALQKQQGSLQQTSDKYDKLSTELDKLKHKGDELALVNSITFDPLQRQIQQLVNGMKEVPFDQIVAGIKTQQGALNTATHNYDTATAAVNRQQAAVNAATKARDIASATYDRDNKRLQGLQNAYNALGQAISDVNSKLQAMAQAGQNAAAAIAAAKKAAPTEGTAAKNFDAAKGGNFATANLGATLQTGNGGGIKAIDALTKRALDATKKPWDKIDIFGPFKGMWNKFTGWWDRTVVGGVEHLVSRFGGAFGGIGHLNLGAIFSHIGDFISSIFNSHLVHTIEDVASFVGKLIGLFAKLAFPEVVKFFKSIWTYLTELYKEVFPRIRPLLTAIGKLFQEIWIAIKPLAILLGGVFLLVWKTLASALNGGVREAFKGVARVLGDVIRVITDLINFVVDVFTGKWGKAWHDIVDLFEAIFKTIGDFLRGVWDTFLGIVSGAVQGFLNFFKALGLDIVHGIWVGIKNGFNWIVNLIKGWVSDVVDWFKNLFGIHSPSTVFASIGGFLIKGLWNGIVGASHLIWEWVKNLLPAILSLLGKVGTWLLGVGKNIITGLWDGIKWVAQSVWTWFSNVPSKIINTIGNVANLLYQAGKDILTGLWNGIKFVASSVWSWLTNTWSSLTDLITSPFHAAAKVIGEIWTGIKTGMHNFITAVGNIMGALGKTLGTPVYYAVHYVINPLITGFNYIPGIPDIPHINDKDIPHFRSGGVVPGGHNRDDVPIFATPGEVVVPKDILNRLGGAQQFMDALGIGGNGNDRHFAAGGQVPTGPGMVGGINLTGSVGTNFNPVSSVTDWASSVWDAVVKKFRAGAADAFMASVGNPMKSADNVLDKFGVFGVGLDHGIDSGIDSFAKWIRGNEEKANSGGAIPTGSHLALIKQALTLAHQPLLQSYIDDVNTIVDFESGWKPTAINLTDSNAQAGHPSQGLMQTIPSTFEAYRLKSLPDMITDPLANMVAGIRYAVSRYGNLNDVPGIIAVHNGGKYVGYDQGGILPPGASQVFNGTGQNELIAPQKIFKDVMRAYSSEILRDSKTLANGGGTTDNSKHVSITISNVSFPNVSSADDAEDFLKSLEVLAEGEV